MNIGKVEDIRDFLGKKCIFFVLLADLEGKRKSTRFSKCQNATLKVQVPF